jgi:hypothetical protein
MALAGIGRPYSGAAGVGTSFLLQIVAFGVAAAARQRTSPSGRLETLIDIDALNFVQHTVSTASSASQAIAVEPWSRLHAYGKSLPHGSTAEERPTSSFASHTISDSAREASREDGITVIQPQVDSMFASLQLSRPEDAGKNQNITSQADGRLPRPSNLREKQAVLDAINIKTQAKMKYIATPHTIVLVFIIIYTPILAGWFIVAKCGWQQKHVAVMLSISLCGCVIGLDLVNQSLSVIMDAPMAITAVQAVALLLILGFMTGVQEVIGPSSLTRQNCWPLATWACVAVAFTVFQLANHLVSYWCSLCERTIFMNLCPVVSILVESFAMPKSVRISVGARSVIALATMVLGAILFGVQYPDFSAQGVLVAALLVVILIPYRLAQRWFLHDCVGLPLPLLAAFDGLILTIPSAIISGERHPHSFFATWGLWFEQPAIATLIILSCFTFAALHCCGLAMLRLGSATNYLVMANLANVIVVLMGIFFFHEKVAGKSLEIAGLTLSLFAGLWYAGEECTAMRVEESKGTSKAVVGKDKLVGGQAGRRTSWS